jgi:hypothetical protein
LSADDLHKRFGIVPPSRTDILPKSALRY